MKKLFLFIALPLLWVSSLTAQANNNEISTALSEFMQTKFMRKFSDLRVQAETEIAAFRASSAQYDPQQVARVRMAYDQTAQRFNGLLNKIKMDFLDRQKLKYQASLPIVGLLNVEWLSWRYLVDELEGNPSSQISTIVMFSIMEIIYFPQNFYSDPISISNFTIKA